MNSRRWRKASRACWTTTTASSSAAPSRARKRAGAKPAWSKLAELGVTALGIPEAFGGLDGGASDRLPVMQAFGRALLLEPYLASSVLAATAVLSAGSEAQKDRPAARARQRRTAHGLGA